MTVGTKLEKIIDLQCAVTLYDEVVGMLYEIASFETDDTVADVVCKIAGWLKNRSNTLSDKEYRIFRDLLKLEVEEE
ncbi:MAG: hypothetical protein IJV90_05970 [Candidatus Methanomethylophilaceae archaeon]|nr:hypothetical protein [Candidatus Methanomethylophilaceae archaeon]